MQTITNTINCVGVMGAGLALQFKNRFPLMYIDYKIRAKNESIKVGFPYIWKPDNDEQWILNFPTKIHWKNKSKLEWIDEGLIFFCQNYEKWGITSIAFPALGCDLGGLDWNKVSLAIFKNLTNLKLEVELFEPLAKPDSK